jgi:hypothetical protein
LGKKIGVRVIIMQFVFCVKLLMGANSRLKISSALTLLANFHTNKQGVT